MTAFKNITVICRVFVLGIAGEMEAISCVKAVILAASQYKHHKSDDNMLYLLRQLDVGV